jgi:hypothetical protein
MSGTRNDIPTLSLRIVTTDSCDTAQWTNRITNMENKAIMYR